MSKSGTRLTAGTAATTITPDRPLNLQGYVRGPASGTLDPLETRAIVFDDGKTRAAIVSTDLIGLDYPSVARIRAIAEDCCGIPGDHVMVSCSHTHSGPAVQTLRGLPSDPQYLDSLERKLGELVADADSRRQSVNLGTGEGAADFNVNRRLRTPEGIVMRANPDGVVDKRVRVLRVDPVSARSGPGTLGGRPLPQSEPMAILFSYVCHATVLGHDNFRYSGDYPGEARRFVERAYGSDEGDGTVAMFLPGCFGDVRPNLLGDDGAFRGGTDHELIVLGRLLGSEVVQAAERIDTRPAVGVAVARRVIELPLASVPDESKLRAAPADESSRNWAETMLKRLERDGRLPDSEVAEVQVMRLGPHWLVTLPGEAMLEIGLSIERGLHELGLATCGAGALSLAIGYTNGNVGYLCTASAISEGGFEPAVTYANYLRPAPFAPGVERVLIDTALVLAQEIAHRGD